MNPMKPLNGIGTLSSHPFSGNPAGEGALNQLKHLKNSQMDPEVSSKNKEKLKEAAQDFEALFILETLKAMDKTVQKSGWITGGQGEEMFKEMLQYERAKGMARGNGMGLGDALYFQLLGEKPEKKSG